MRILDSDAPASHVPPGTPAVAIERMRWAGPLTVLASLGGVHVVRLIAVRVVDIRAASGPLGWIAPTADTVILVTIGLAVFTGVAGFADRPIRRWRWVACGALLFSFVPLLVASRGPLARVALALAMMHVAAYLPCVTLLPWMTTVKTESQGLV